MTYEERVELKELRAAFVLSGLGDCPQSMAVDKLRRLIELEREETQELLSRPAHRHTPGCGHFNSYYEL